MAVKQRLYLISFILTLIIFAYTPSTLIGYKPTLNQLPDMPVSQLVSNLIHITLPGKPDEMQQKVIDSWKTLNPNHEIRIYCDQDMENLIKDSYPEFYPLYSNMFSIVEKTDIWRYLIIHYAGGLYVDADFYALKPIDEWLKRIESNPSIILSLEFLDDGLQFANWWLYGAKGHPFFYRVVRDLALRFRFEVAHGVSFGDAVSRTGPERLTQTANTFLFEIGVVIDPEDWRNDDKIECFGDVCVLGRNFMGMAEDRNDWESERVAAAFAKHLFRGSWKRKDRFLQSRAKLWELHEKWEKGLVAI